MEQGATQAQVAKLANVSVRTYHDWESGKRTPRAGPALVSIAEVLRRNPLYLLFGEGDPYAQH
jgi:transcriptional regulator with XRE-family HTH domain